jgi:hypothetical protein
MSPGGGADVGIGVHESSTWATWLGGTEFGYRVGQLEKLCLVVLQLDFEQRLGFRRLRRIWYCG